MTALRPDIIRHEIENLRHQFGELETDEAAWIASLESETDLTELLSRLVDSWRNDESMCVGIKGRIDELKEREERLGQRAKAKREVARALLQAANVRKLELPEATLSIRAGGERVEIAPDCLVPHEFCKITYVPNKTLIKAKIESGELKANWALLVRSSDSISVRTK